MPTSVTRFRSVFGSGILQVKYGSCEISCFQIVHRYDPKGHYRYGFIYTNMSDKEIAKRNSGYGRKTLYMKLKNPEHGLFEISMDNVHIKQIDDGVLWFHHDGTSSLHILKKPTKNTFSGF